jgi:hypothetical protein
MYNVQKKKDRQHMYNVQKKKDRQHMYNVQKKMTKGQRTIYKTLQRKLVIEQHKPH